MQVIDRSAGHRLHAEARAGLGLEALLSLFVLNQSVPLERYEQAEMFRQVTSRRLPAAVERAVKRLKTPSGDPWLGLLALAAAGGSTHDLQSVVRMLRATPPVELKATMLGVHQRVSDAGEIRRAAAGGRGAAADLMRLSREQGFSDEVAALLPIPPKELAGLAIDALSELPATLYSGGTDGAQLLARNAAEANRLLAEVDNAQVVIDQLVGESVYKPEHGITTAILVPSLVHRPLTLVTNHEHTKVICYPALLEDQLSAPAGGLIGVYRALGDGTRLRILRRLAAGSATVARISEELGLAKSTVHEHLLSLRSAGLVRLPSTGGFTIEPELPDLNWMLKEFLGLEMRRTCETCGRPLEVDGPAYICSFECTFCEDCARRHEFVCPNCRGELVQRPRRSRARAAGRRPGSRNRN